MENQFGHCAICQHGGVGGVYGAAAAGHQEAAKMQLFLQHLKAHFSKPFQQ